MNAKEIVARAREKGTVIPAYNIPYLPMVEPIVRAVKDENSLAMIQVARVEWEKFSAGSPEQVAQEYHKYAHEAHTLLHLDHVPVVDEDMLQVEYLPLLERAIEAGYGSVMIDASRLPFLKNIAHTKKAAQLAHGAGIPIEAELGAVLGHESGPMMPYEEIFATKTGFTDLGEAQEFVQKSECDWLSVAVGNIHGAVAEATRHQKKPTARLDVQHIKMLYEATGVPLVLHGGSGIDPDYIKQGIAAGIAKINVGTELRQAYENGLLNNGGEKEAAKEAVYLKVREIICDMLEIKNTRTLVLGE